MNWTFQIWSVFCILSLLSCGGEIPRFHELHINPTWGLNRDECSDNTRFRIGCGIHDITGPPAERLMIGYVNPDQKTGGIHIRLRSRAFVIESPCNGNRVVFVSADLGMISQAVKQKVIEKLQARYRDLYTSDNVILSATHTHSGPGGYSHYFLYYSIALGFDERNFNTIVDGIYQSIVKADRNLEEGTIKMASGELTDTGWNRSRPAYQNNLDWENHPDTDALMTVLKLETSEENERKEIGMISWFPVHATSIGNTNSLISGDNKGYASYCFEKLKQTDYLADKTFVAAFAQSHEGDVTPNDPNQSDPIDDFERARQSGEKQFQKALDLYNKAEELLKGGVNYRHSYVDFSDLTVDGRWTGEGPQKTCPAAIGISTLAGTEDGRGLPFIEEGWTRANLPSFKQHVVFEEIEALKRVVENREDKGFSVRVRRFNRRPFRWLPLKKRLVMRTEPCQGAKPVVLETGLSHPPWTPQILPVQIVTIGQLDILAVPVELTTMAGRRLRETVSAALSSSGIKHVVIAGLSNAYAGYVTTQKEYEVQHYEGASTHFGPWTLAAFQQEFHKLAVALRDGKTVPIGPLPLDLTNHLLLKHATQTLVAPEPDAGFGSVIQDAKPTYRRGETVRVTFFGGHPNHDFKIQSTYLEVQRKEGTDWVTIARDWDDETKYRWVRQNGFSQVTIEWTIPTDAREFNRVPSGTYRIRHSGHSKNKKGRLTPYAGTSREFEVVG